MVLKQELSQQCTCGQTIELPGGEIVATCKCRVIWELGPEGYWAITSKFAPIVVRPKLRADEYPRYPRCKKRRKAGQ